MQLLIFVDIWLVPILLLLVVFYVSCASLLAEAALVTAALQLQRIFLFDPVAPFDCLCVIVCVCVCARARVRACVRACVRAVRSRASTVGLITSVPVAVFALKYTRYIMVDETLR